MRLIIYTTRVIYNNLHILQFRSQKWLYAVQRFNYGASEIQ